MENIDQDVLNEWVQRVSVCYSVDEAQGVCSKIPNPYLIPVLRELYEIRCKKDTSKFFSDKVKEFRKKDLENLFEKYDQYAFNDDLKRKGIRIVYFSPKINYVVKLWEDKIKSSTHFFSQVALFVGVWVYWYFSSHVRLPNEGFGKTDMSSHFPEGEARRLMGLAREKMKTLKHPSNPEDTKICRLCSKLESKEEQDWKPALIELERIILSKYFNSSPDETTQGTLEKIKIILAQDSDDAFRKSREKVHIEGNYYPRYRK
ncbi:MAG: hypothetical protein PHS95_00250 [Candidatus Pacebacteria bacterium]|nr:hypothetical protein [Candidatus Paceibacterota bacterium]